MAEYICPKCTEKLKRNVKHKPGSQVFEDHLKFIQKPDVIIGENDAIPEELIQGLLETEASIQLTTDSGKPIFVVSTRPQEVDLTTIPPNVTYVQTIQGIMAVVRFDNGNVAGLFDPGWTISRANFRAAQWEYFVPDPNEPQCRKFIQKPFNQVEMLRNAPHIAKARHKHYLWIQKVLDTKKIKELENDHAKPKQKEG